MKIRKGFIATLVIGLICLCFVGAPVSAAKVETLQVEATNYVVSSQWLPVGDEEGHVIGLQQREGEAVLSSGETAKYTAVSNFDSRRGKGGTATGYTKFVFVDESMIVFSWTADFFRDKDGLTCSKGEGTIIMGAGRFAGITGKSVFSGKQLQPASLDPKLTSIANATITYTLP